MNEQTYFIKYQKSRRQEIKTFPSTYFDLECAIEAAQSIEELGMYRVWVDNNTGKTLYDSWGEQRIY